MKEISSKIMRGSIIVFLFSISLSLKSQVKQGLPPSDTLYQKILHLDSLVFGAFNKRDTSAFAVYFSKSLEFYHDIGGLTGFEETTGFLKSLIKQKSDLKRYLIKGTFEVYPIPGYGVMELGTHQFVHTENGKQIIGTFKFLHIWKKDNNDWIITRVISYGH
ncbi:MAG: nuclear transport factor 2 family protein [Bacteroidetes bacterium]|nr:nuclear transport factor 2 family protein [Bacteroidota bacterium]MBS1929889.1 nuclear transport factor 2 family protein [Bacteroidota bacterium]